MECKPKETEAMRHPGIVGTELDEGHISRSTPEHTQSPSKKPLSPESRQELKQFVEKWRVFIDDPSLLDQPMRTVAEFFREAAIEEGLIGE
ncbi:MAG: hypothetical protein JW878_10005 [Methanomicrobia archaeon]|nr:hypothetical protein [Methanomicrobia archaeon]